MTQADSVHSTPPTNTSALPNVTDGQSRPAGLLESGLAIQQRERETALAELRRLKQEASSEVERLLTFLDSVDGYTLSELEEAVDDVPCDDQELEFNFCGVTADAGKMPFTQYDDELEIEEGNDEPSLAHLNSMCQPDATAGLGNDLEDEHDGREDSHDAEDDRADSEPSLGWPEGHMAHGQGMLGGWDDRELAADPVVTDADRRQYTRATIGNVTPIPGAQS